MDSSKEATSKVACRKFARSTAWPDPAANRLPSWRSAGFCATRASRAPSLEPAASNSLRKTLRHFVICVFLPRSSERLKLYLQGVRLARNKPAWRFVDTASAYILAARAANAISRSVFLEKKRNRSLRFGSEALPSGTPVWFDPLAILKLSGRVFAAPGTHRSFSQRYGGNSVLLNYLHRALALRPVLWYNAHSLIGASPIKLAQGDGWESGANSVRLRT